MLFKNMGKSTITKEKILEIRRVGRIWVARDNRSRMGSRRLILAQLLTSCGVSGTILATFY